MNTKIIRKHFFFKGRVQGVGKKSLRRLGRNGGARH